MNIDTSFMTSLKQKRSYIDILTERFMQSIDDYQQYNSIKKSYNRYMNDPIGYKSKKTSFLNNKITEKIVILSARLKLFDKLIENQKKIISMMNKVSRNDHEEAISNILDAVTKHL